jgi:hypothetical protein
MKHFLILFITTFCVLGCSSSEKVDRVAFSQTTKLSDEKVFEAQKVAVKYFKIIESKNYDELIGLFERQTIKSKVNSIKARVGRVYRNSWESNPLNGLSDSQILVKTTINNLKKYSHIDFTYNVLGGVRDGSHLIHFTVKQTIVAEGSSRKHRYLILTLNNYSGEWKVERRKKLSGVQFRDIYLVDKDYSKIELEDLLAFKLL